MRNENDMKPPIVKMKIDFLQIHFLEMHDKFWIFFRLKYFDESLTISGIWLCYFLSAFLSLRTHWNIKLQEIAENILCPEDGGLVCQHQSKYSPVKHKHVWLITGDLNNSQHLMDQSFSLGKPSFRKKSVKIHTLSSPLPKVWNGHFFCT